MSVMPSAEAAALGGATAPLVNDFSIQVATVNGSGSQTANTVLMRSIFQMGVPVSGKNLFPSNIAGLPTWFTIRASRHGYIGRKKEIDFLIAMNPETAQDDVAELAPGSAVIYDEPLKLNARRDDLHFYPVPFDKLVAPVCPDAKLRKLVRNMLYDGVAAQLLGLDLDEVETALFRQFGAKKQRAAETELERRAGGPRVRALESHQDRPLPRRAHERDRRQDHHRRQLGRGHGLRLRRRDGRHLVSHHAVVLARGNDD